VPICHLPLRNKPKQRSLDIRIRLREAATGILALSVSLWPVCSVAATSTLERIVVTQGQNTGYQLETRAKPTRVNHFSLTNPARYVVDLYGTDLAPSLKREKVIEQTSSDGVESIRLGEHEGPRVRIVFDLSSVAASNNVSVATTQGTSGALVSVFFTGKHDKQVTEAPPADAKEASQTMVAAMPRSTADAGADNNKSNRRIVFGNRAATAPSDVRSDSSAGSTGDTGNWNLTADRLLLESGYGSTDLGSGSNSHLQLVVGIEGPLASNWSMKLAGRIDGHHQGNNLPELNYVRLDYDEAWIRYQNDSIRLTAGAQRIIWGRADEFSPTDRLSTRDFTRLVLDDLQDRRRANPALRLQWFSGNRSLDLVYLPVFREAELPADESLWSPLDPSTGAVAGLPLGDAPLAALRGATLSNDFEGNEGYGARFSDSKSGWDYAVTVQRVNNPEPYFTLQRPPTPTAPAVLDTVYPRTWLVGGDLAVAAGAWTLRAEAAWLSDALYTDASDFSLRQSEELNWALGAEVFPGDRDLRLTFQVSGRHLLDTQNPVDFTDVLSAVGELETPFVFGGLPWKAQVRYSFRLDESGSYINPELTFTGWEPSELYLGAHFFSGDYGTLEGYYAERDLVVLGWRAKF